MIIEFTIYPEFFILFSVIVWLIQFGLVLLLDRKIRMLYQIEREAKKPKPKKVIDKDEPTEQHFK